MNTDLNKDAHYALHLFLSLNACLIIILALFESYMNKIDKVIIYIFLIVHTIFLYSIAHYNYDTIRMFHWAYPFYFAIAPFIVTTLAGKLIYTFFLLLQMSLYISFRRCIISTLKFKKDDKCKPYVILPKSIPYYIFGLIQIALLMYIWLKK